MSTVRVAALDCGTNSLRLLVADADLAARTLTDVDRRMEVVRLGQGVDATGRLAPRALERTMQVLRTYRKVIDAAGVSAVRMVATSATRDAANAADFVAGVTGILGAAPVVLSGEEEAGLSFAGATAELAGIAAAPYLVADIGGGSTEFVVGGAAQAAGDTRPGGAAQVTGEVTSVTAAGGAGTTAAVSVNIGCVRMTERHLRGDPPSAAQVAAAMGDIDAALETAAARVPVASARTLVGLAGSVTTVAALALGLTDYDAARIHHSRISASDVAAQASRLLARTHAERARLGPMHPGRVNVIGGGALILARIMARFGFADVLVSEHDILDGIVWELAGEDGR